MKANIHRSTRRHSPAFPNNPLGAPQTHAQARSPPGTKWVLKANIHRGKGVQVVPQPDAVLKALERAAPEGGGVTVGDSGEGDGFKHVLVQSYMNPQVCVERLLLLAGFGS